MKKLFAYATMLMTMIILSCGNPKKTTSDTSTGNTSGTTADTSRTDTTHHR